MLRFLIGDELGNIKSLRYSPDAGDGCQTESKTIHSGSIIKGRPNAVQALAANSGRLAAAHADGSVKVHNLNDDRLETLREWKESRFQPKQKFVGLHISDRNVYSCTSDGALRMTMNSDDQNSDLKPSHNLASLPTRLCAWRLSSDEGTFSYGGDEVDLSVWNTEKVFSHIQENNFSAPSTSSRKRKRANELFPGETWRARNVPHDTLNLRQPIHITSLTYISPCPSASQHHLLTGTLLGDVRRYDTRVARRPVADWKGIGKTGGVKVVEKGLQEHEAFVADGGSNLFSLDLRTGRVVYGYKGLSGAVTSIAPAPSILASTAFDRLCRIHSTYPPHLPGTRQDKKGEVLQKVFVNSIPVVVLWDQCAHPKPSDGNQDIDIEDDEVWDTLKQVDDNTAR